MAKEKKPQLVDQLEEIAKYLEILGENDFKIRAYRKGADALREDSGSLQDIAQGKTKVAGIGEGLRGAIQEFLDTGTIAQHQELAAKVPPAVLELLEVPGVGPKKALVIHNELGVNSVGELEYACRENRLLTLKGFGKALQEKILAGIEQIKSNAGKCRLDEARARAEKIQEELKTHLGKKAEVIQVGALGRHAEVVENLELYFTGSADKVGDAVAGLPWKAGLEERREKPFETELAGYCGQLSDGFSLTLWVSEERPDRRTLQWLCADDDAREALEHSPRKFENWEPSWIEMHWIDAHRVPSDSAYRQARDGNVKGIFHCHTTFSDGVATLEQMVKSAEARGYQYIGISDHSQTAFYAQGLKPDRIREQSQLIKDLQKKVSIRIFHGIESDILADGALDYDEEILASLDFIVGSIHSRFKMDVAAMTDRIVAALKNPHLTIWGHPTGRLLLGRSGYGLDWDACFKAAVSNGVAIEINANPHRLDLDWRLGGEIEKYKSKVCINPDAHATEGLDDTVYGEFMAEKAMIPREQILNLMSVDEMEKYLWQRKRRTLKSSA